jgi:pimeloyl-ACP methyl ester carboxylesterase
MCCRDDLDPTYHTGCGDYYDCALNKVEFFSATTTNNDDHSSLYFCQKSPHSPNADDPDQTPRYKTCRVPSRSLTELYGIPVSNDMHHNRTAKDAPQLAYLSTMGPIDSGDPVDLQRHAHVTTLVVIVHGSGRNVDDYLCCSHAALPIMDQDSDNSTILLVAPWFKAPSDPHSPRHVRSSAHPPSTTIHTVHGFNPLVWNEYGPIFHTWRYGADAVNAPVSSYAAMDALIAAVVQDTVRFSRVHRIVVAGHSAGGQYVQRWALLSNANKIWQHPTVTIRVVVANPKSYCYMDARRYDVHGIYQLPSAHDRADCPTYNQWEWGLDVGDYLPTPYKDQAIAVAGGVDRIVQRYATRNVVYLTGEKDVIPNGDCEARMQGAYRRERSAHFFASLQEVYGRTVHRRSVVKNVHHDHCLMFQSPEGYEAFFGSLPNAQY